MSCCEFHSKVECGQGDFCTLRAFYAETEGVFPCVTGCSTKALPDPAKQPLPVIYKPRSNAQATAKWFAVLIIFAGLSAVSVLQAPRFFN
jgi:hypothetical protein